VQAKLCTRCKIEKPLSEFYKDQTKRYGVTPRCKVCLNIQNRAWAIANADRTKEIHSRWYQENKNEHLRKGKLWKSTHLKNCMLYRAKERSKKEGLPFDLCIEDIIIPDCCPILGITLVASTKKAVANSPSLDKIIPGLGYIRGNIQVISQLANWMKSNATPKEMLLFAEWVMETYGN